jgi:hypothetical protein
MRSPRLDTLTLETSVEPFGNGIRVRFASAGRVFEVALEGSDADALAEEITRAAAKARLRLAKTRAAAPLERRSA